MAVDYRKLCIEIFGTDDENEIRRKVSAVKKYGSGRKNKFTEKDVAELRNLYSSGMTIEMIAKKYSTSRQIVSKYLTEPIHSGCTMRMTYMYKKKPCTEIDVDFLNRKIYIQNKTNDILHRAFGVIEQPTWGDFEYFIEERCPPKTRGNIKDILKELSVPDYDPISIIERTKGKCVDDDMWIKCRYRPTRT